MDINDLIRVNSLWRKLYPYLVSQIMEGYHRESGTVLELGPFSGGIAMELVRLYPEFEITIADESPEVVEYIEKKVSASGLAQGIAVKKTDLNNLAFSDCQFDLVVFRGAFFFLSSRENLLREIFRLLKDGGMAFVGGGYGKGVPKQLIDEICDESRVLNDRLGRRWLSIRELEEMIRRSKLASHCKIKEEGGVWLDIRK